MLGDDEQINQELCNIAVKDRIFKERIELKNIKRKIELYHVGNVKLCYLDQTIKTFMEKDKKESKKKENTKIQA